MNTINFNEVTLARAIDAFRNGQLDEAQGLLLSVLETEPENPDALYFMAMIDQQCGRTEVAEHRARDLLRIRPGDGKACNLLGNILMSQGKLDAAMETFADGIARDKTDASIRANAAICQIGLVKPDDAIELCREALGINPAYPNAHNIMGMAYQARGELEQAATSFQNAIDCDAGFLDAVFNLGKVRLDQDDLGIAAELFDQVLEHAPENPHALTRKGDVLTRLGDYEAAAKCYTTVLAQYPSFDPADIGAGKLLQHLGKQAEALGHFKSVIERNPDNTEALMHAGDAFRQLHNHEAAAAAFRDVLAIDPDNFQAKYHLAAVTGDAAPVKPDSGYVRQLFDEFANDFDDSLGKVGYDAPDQLHALASEFLPGAEDNSLDIVDLGCGTGLSGMRFKPLARSLTGIDLSGRMLEKARARNIYDELEASELLDALVRHQHDTDLVISADVFPYIGDLQRIFLSVYSALRPGGLFLFSTEAHADGDDFRLQPTGRYCHSAGYIRQLADKRGFEVLACNDSSYRTEGGKPVSGLVVALRKNSDHPGLA